MAVEAPIPLDAEDAPNPNRKPTARALWGPVKWLCLGIGLVLALAAFNANAIQAAAPVGLACFMGICGRVAQAEEHRR